MKNENLIRKERIRKRRKGKEKERQEKLKVRKRTTKEGRWTGRRLRKGEQE